MNISAGNNAYYVERQPSNTFVNLITNIKPQNFDNENDLLPPEITPQQALNNSRPSTAKHQKVVIEIDGKEVDPVQILFEKAPLNKEERLKEFIKVKTSLTKRKLKEFKTYNEKLMQNKELKQSQLQELDLNFKKNIKKLRDNVNKKKLEDSQLLELPKKRNSNQQIDYNERKYVPSKKYQEEHERITSLSGPRKVSSGFNPFPGHRTKEVEEVPVTIQPEENPQRSSSFIISNAIWNTFNYYWKGNSNYNNNNEKTNKDEVTDDREVVKKVYKKLKNGQIVLVEVKELDNLSKEVEKSNQVVTGYWQSIKFPFWGS